MIDPQSTATAEPGIDALRNGRPGEMLKLAAERKLGRTIDVSDKRQVRQAAAQLTSQLFFAPLLAEMRKSPLGGKFGGGGRTEEVFGEQLDLRMADAVASRNPGGLVAKIAKKLAARHDSQDEASDPTQSAPDPTDHPRVRVLVSDLWVAFQSKLTNAAPSEAN